ncbi:hypothetical protein K1719_033047 [Acacia pycnantha]|nr:hypothetical protein K1719_033047 [Acacia pycnantha]
MTQDRCHGREEEDAITVNREAIANEEGSNLKIRPMRSPDCKGADYGIVRRLRFLNSMLEIAEEVIGLSVEIPEIPDPLLKPWQLPYLIQPITTSDFVLH